MVLKTVGIAGTLESSDAMITVEPAINFRRNYGN